MTRDYLELRPYRAAIVTPRLVSCMIGFMCLFGVALMALTA